MTFIISTNWDGQKRKLYLHNCKLCEKEFYAPLKQHAKYCSRKCATKNKHLQNSSETICGNCGKIFRIKNSGLSHAKHGIRFCSRECKDKAQQFGGSCPGIRPSFYGKTFPKYVYRGLAIRTYGAICNKCGYNAIEKMLDVHHRDGNRENNSTENLEILCVWCHALETRKNW